MFGKHAGRLAADQQTGRTGGGGCGKRAGHEQKRAVRMKRLRIGPGVIPIQLQADPQTADILAAVLSSVDFFNRPPR